MHNKSYGGYSSEHTKRNMDSTIQKNLKNTESNLNDLAATLIQ